jgi:hypothetical protein
LTANIARGQGERLHVASNHRDNLQVIGVKASILRQDNPLALPDLGKPLVVFRGVLEMVLMQFYVLDTGGLQGIGDVVNAEASIEKQDKVMRPRAD